MRLDQLQPGDNITMFPYDKRAIPEVRIVSRTTKRCIVDNKGRRWTRTLGREWGSGGYFFHDHILPWEPKHDEQIGQKRKELVDWSRRSNLEGYDWFRAPAEIVDTIYALLFAAKTTTGGSQ